MDIIMSKQTETPFQKYVNKLSPGARATHSNPKPPAVRPPAAVPFDNLNELKTPEVKLEVWTIGKYINTPAVKFQRPLDDKRENKLFKHLKTGNISPSVQSIVHIVYRTDLKTHFVVDGNTRRKYYVKLLRSAADGSFVKVESIPTHVNVIIHTADSEEEQHLMYLSLDAPGAAETSAEKVGGAALTLSMNFKNPALMNHNFWAGMKEFSGMSSSKLDKDVNAHEIILTHFSEQLDYIDKNLLWLDKDIKRMGGECISILLTMLHARWDDPVDPEQIMQFFNYVGSRVSMDTKSGNKKCAITFMVNEYDKENRNKKYSHKSTHRMKVLGMWCYYFNRWQCGKYSASLLKNTDASLVKLARDFCNI